MNRITVLILYYIYYIIYLSYVPSLCIFEIKLNLGDAALRIEANIDAASFPSCPAGHIYNCLQQHILKLQVKW